MNPGNLLTIFKCGCLTGILWSLSQMVLIICVNKLGLLSGSDLNPIGGNWFFLLDTLAGVLAVTCYATLRTASVSIPRAMSITVFVWLLSHTLILNGGGIEYTIPLAALVSLLSVMIMSLCLLAGVWPYEVLQNAQKHPTPSSN